jgi:hypothetical protein
MTTADRTKQGRRLIWVISVSTLVTLVATAVAALVAQASAVRAADEFCESIEGAAALKIVPNLGDEVPWLDRVGAAGPAPGGIMEQFIVDNRSLPWWGDCKWRWSEHAPFGHRPIRVTVIMRRRLLGTTIIGQIQGTEHSAATQDDIQSIVDALESLGIQTQVD